MVTARDYGRIGRSMLRHSRSASPDLDLPPLSVVITAHNQAQALRRHLPTILEQDYGRFEVIVVNMSSTDETLDVLERLELQYANLRHTYTPRSARDISVERLALTLGIRSATYEWVIITHPDCEPVSSQWLMQIGETIAEPSSGAQSSRLTTPDMLLGMARYSRQRTSLFDTKVAFYRLWNDMANINHVLSGHAAIRADGCNLVFRKAYFMERGGFSAHQNLQAGAEELLVNYTSKPDNTALLLHPSTLMLQDPMPARRLWKQQRVFYVETRRHQQHHYLYRHKQAVCLLMPWLMLLSAIVLCFMPSMAAHSDLIRSSNTLLTLYYIAIVLLLLLYVIFKLKQFKLTTRQLDAPNAYLTLLLGELRMPFWHLSAAIAHRFASKNEFRKKFI